MLIRALKPHRYILFALAALLLPTTARAALPQVEIQTNMGAITVELDPTEAPQTVTNFLQYVENGFYQGTIFHRVIDGFMIQGGGFTTDFKQKETRAPITNEADNRLPHYRGTIAMARTGDPHSATAQFFINTSTNKSLNHTAKNERGWGYCVFGRVIRGMDVVMKIGKTRTGRAGPFPKDVPRKAIVITKATLLPEPNSESKN